MRKKLNDDEYECALCHGVFQLVRDDTWSEEQAKQEARDIFGKDIFEKDVMRVVCDDCWQKIKP